MTIIWIEYYTGHWENSNEQWAQIMIALYEEGKIIIAKPEFMREGNTSTVLEQDAKRQYLILVR